MSLEQGWIKHPGNKEQ